MQFKPKQRLIAVLPFLLGCAAIALITAGCFWLTSEISIPTCLYLLVIVLLSLRGSLPASAALSFIAVACLDYFFVPPVFSFVVSDPSDIVAIVTFLTASAIVTRLVSKVHAYMQERLEQSEAYLSEAQRLSHTGSFGWKISSGDILWSEETFRIFEYDHNTKPTVERVFERTHPDDVAIVKDTVERASMKGEGFDIEHRLLMPNGSVKHLHIVAHLNGRRSGEMEFVGSVMDITEAKRSEDALRQARAELAHVSRLTTMGELTASIAHEVNQPLASIVINGNAGLRWLGGEVPNLDEARRAIGRIVRDGQRAGDIISKIRLLFSKAQTAKEKLDLGEIIYEVVALTRNEIQKNAVILGLQVANDLPAIRGDRVQIQQVLMNLIMNAIEAMNSIKDRPRRLGIKACVLDAESVCVEVRDSGVGLEAKETERIFDAFRTSKPSGLGMGLAISRSIVEDHGGQLKALLEDGPGATFQFTLLTFD